MLTKNNIKFINNLSIKKFRLINKLFVVEGEKIVNELLLSDFAIQSVYATKKWIDDNSKNHFITANEGSAISMGIGHHLAMP